jgi:predicted Fe-Mo cluster-binding NifX family protein
VLERSSFSHSQEVSRRFLFEIKDGLIVSVEVVENPAASYKHGAGPIVVKILAEKGVTAVAARELGLGASTLLEQNNIKNIMRRQIYQ